MTMKSAGKMHSSMGKRILTGIFCAFSSASCRRAERISFDCSRRTLATGRPRRSAWTRALTKVLIAGTLVRSPRDPKAAALDLPIWISEMTRANSPATGPSTERATCMRAASKPCPASTQTVSMSSASARLRCRSS